MFFYGNSFLLPYDMLGRDTMQSSPVLVFSFGRLGRGGLGGWIGTGAGYMDPKAVFFYGELKAKYALLLVKRLNFLLYFL